MKTNLFLTALSVIILSSCSSIYKAGQTPDDVYYSPAKEVQDEIKFDKRVERNDDYYSSIDDNYLRMMVRNRYRWNSLDDYDYWFDSRYNYCNTNTWNYNKVGWNSWYIRNNCSCINNSYTNYGWRNPLFYVVAYKNPKVYSGNTSMTNIYTFKNSKYNNTNFYNSFIKGSGNNNSSGFGKLLMQVFSSGSSNSNTNSWGTPVRSFESGTTTSSNAGGKSGGYESKGSSTSTPRAKKNN